MARSPHRIPRFRKVGPTLVGPTLVGLALISLALVGLLPVGAPSPAGAEDISWVALDPSEETFALEERGCGDETASAPDCSELSTALGEQRGWIVRSFDQVTATLPSRLRSGCDVGPGDVGWPTVWIRCFDEADTDQRLWLTQGMGGTDEWRTPETPGGGDHYLVATWCWKGPEGFRGTDFCDEDEPIRRTRISLISVERDAYRHVELVEPYVEDGDGADRRVAARPILLHAGGAALAGRWLYVADTDWLYVFNLDHFVRHDDGPDRLPVWARYATADDDVRERHNLFSSISIDGSGPDPRLVAAEYRLNPSAEAAVTLWPLRRDGRLRTDGARIETVATWMVDGDSIIDHVQGVASRGDLFLFSESSNRIERTPAGVPRRREDRCIRWGRGTGEDLYASPGRDLLVGINESTPFTASAFWAVSYRQAFGLTPAPEGFPRRRC